MTSKKRKKHAMFQ